MRILIYILCLVTLFLPFTVDAQERPAPVLVELFTAENCPACPPADAYLAQLARSEHVMALACHVDYFGPGSAYLGKKLCTKRQEIYRKQLGKNKFYTPQMMINGTVEEIGYKTAKVAAKISQARSNRSKHIAIHQKANGVFDFMVPSDDYRKVPAQLWLATYARPQIVSDRGRQKTYVNVVENFMPLGFWQGQAKQQAIFPLTTKETAGFVIAAQDSVTGEILAVGEFRL